MSSAAIESNVEKFVLIFLIVIIILCTTVSIN